MTASGEAGLGELADTDKDLKAIMLSTRGSFGLSWLLKVVFAQVDAVSGEIQEDGSLKGERLCDVIRGNVVSQWH